MSYNKTAYCIIAFLIAFLLGVFVSRAHATELVVCPTSWAFNMGLGANSLDVYKLQVFLNQDPNTQLAATSTGSPGHETTYYGPLTAAAVFRFQQKWADYILFPSGLIGPTSYVGPATRKMLNAICGVSSIGAPL